MLDRIRELWPEVPVVASHQITREWREYERTNTTVLSAYVQPIAASYLRDLSDALEQRGFDGQLYIMQSNCGVQSSGRATEIPITMVESGPACGFFGAAELGRFIGEPNVLALDIGGTTAKCSLIEGGHVKIITDYWIERTRLSAGYPILVPVVDLVEIGNGGGSIAWRRRFRQAARRSCSRRARCPVRRPTAAAGPGHDHRRQSRARPHQHRLFLRRRDRRRHGRGGARAGRVGRAARRRTGTRSRAGIVRIANNNMINALKLVSLNRGYDPRDFTLVAFGGGGGMHAVALAAELGINRSRHPAGR